MVVVEGCEVLLELEGRVELRDLVSKTNHPKETSGYAHFVERHERRPCCHILGLGARVNAPFGVRVDQSLVHLGRCWVEAWRLGRDLILGGRWWAREPW